MKRGCLPTLAVFSLGLSVLAFQALALGTVSDDVQEAEDAPEVVTESVEEEAEFEVIEAEPLPKFESIAEYDEQQEDFENQKIEEALLAKAHRIDNCKITYYCCERYSHICGTGDGLTALGGEVLPGVSCAVPKPIPLGSTIIVDWGDGSDLEYRVGDDRGDAVRGDHIDLAVPTHREALALGVAYATVYWIEEER